MSDHLPECDCPATCEGICDDCICDRIAQAEARVREEAFTEGAIAGVTEMAAVRPARTLAGYREANKYANGVSDERARIRSAVENMRLQWRGPCISHLEKRHVLGVIGNPCDVCGGSGVVACWSPGGPCPNGQSACECCGLCRSCGQQEKS